MARFVFRATNGRLTKQLTVKATNMTGARNSAKAREFMKKFGVRRGFRVGIKRIL